ncbi:helix-turn-helix domain-containing protein [Deinococcus marmoris]|uniref:helix-turn-helix domain-containing protein n=1 Tax=Deinococcus marmoris TaxID=249408 RepID=UPI000556CE30|nr:helix-turn-helix domain-containing protein [Deinococcus marmoris]
MKVQETKESPQQQKTIYTPSEAAVHLGIGRNLIYKLIGSGQLRGVRAGTKWLIPTAALDEFLSGARG